MSSLKSLLTKIGLSEPEIDVYELLLKKGTLAAAEIYPAANLTRTNTYHIINTLLEHKLIDEVPLGAKRGFQVTSPSALKSLVDIQEKRLVDCKDELNEVLPSLIENFASDGKKPLIDQYVGDDVDHIIATEILASKRLVREIITGSNSKETEGQTKLFDDLNKEKIRNSISTKTIFLLNDSTKPPKLHSANKYHFLPPGQLTLATDFSVFGTKVAMISHSTPKCLTIIENKDIVKSHAALFDYIWESSTLFTEQLTTAWRTSGT